MSFIPGAQAQAERARLGAWELLGARDGWCGRAMQRRAAHHALRSSDLQRHFRAVTPGRERFFSPCSPAGQQAALYEPLMASPGFQRKFLRRRSLCCDCCHRICFASSRRNKNLVASAALQCALWTFFLILYMSLFARKRGQCFYSVVQAWIQYCSK